MIAGTNQEKPNLPFSPGMEFAGEVDKINEPNSKFRLGQRVLAYAGHGGMAEYCCVPSLTASRCRISMPADVGAGFLIAHGTAHVALEHRARLEPGERLLVLAPEAAPASPQSKSENAWEAEVIAVARSDAKRDAALRAGASYVIDSGSEISARR